MLSQSFANLDFRKSPDTPIQSDKPPTIIVNNASFFDGPSCYFDNLNLTLPAGTWSCLLGKSGVGKSSLIKIIAGLLPSKVQIQTSDNLPLQGRISYMAQQDLLMPWLTVLDNALLGYRLRREKHHSLREKAIYLLEQVGLKEKTKAYPHELSGGMRARAALVRTIMENKPLVCMDEPFSALDAITKLEIQQLAFDLLKNKTVLLVTHEPWEALRLGHNILIMAGNPVGIVSLPIFPETPRELANPALIPYYQQILQVLGE